MHQDTLLNSERYCKGAEMFARDIRQAQLVQRQNVSKWWLMYIDTNWATCVYGHGSTSGADREFAMELGVCFTRLNWYDVLVAALRHINHNPINANKPGLNLLWLWIEWQWVCVLCHHTVLWTFAVNLNCKNKKHLSLAKTPNCAETTLTLNVNFP